VPGCFADAKALGLCGTDYARYRRGKMPDYKPTRNHRGYEGLAAAGPRFCAAPNCGRWTEANGHCDAHAEQIRRGKDLQPIRTATRADRGCSAEGCDRLHEAHGYCSTHYAYAIGRAEIAVGGRRPVYNGEGYVRVFIPGHPNAHKTGYVLEHIAVMVELIGRPLFTDETVHHRNGVRDDNRPENLELWTSRHPKGQRVEDVVEWAREMLARYDP
jgi:hypothetical protein